MRELTEVNPPSFPTELSKALLYQTFQSPALFTRRFLSEIDSALQHLFLIFHRKFKQAQLYYVHLYQI